MRIRLSQITLCVAAVIISSCSQIDRTWDNPVDPLESQKKAAAPTESPTPTPTLQAQAFPTPDPSMLPHLFFQKFDLPIVSSQFEIKKNSSGSYEDFVFIIKSKFEDSITFFSLERSTNLSQYFWRVNARKYKMTESGLSPWEGLSGPTNVFTECNDPTQGNGVLALRIKGIADKYKSPAFSAESLPDNITHVNVEVDCKTAVVGSSTSSVSSTRNKTISLASLSESAGVVVKPFASDLSIKCTWPSQKLLISATGGLYDYQFNSQQPIPANFYGSSSPLFLGNVAECFDVGGKLQIKTSVASNTCFLFDRSDNSVVTAACAAGNSLRTFQPFQIFHQPYAEESYSNSANPELLLFKVRVGQIEYKLSSSRLTSSSREIGFYTNEVKIPFEPNQTFNNIVGKPSTYARTLVGREQSFGNRILGWSKDKSALFLSNEVISDDSVSSEREVHLTVDYPLESANLKASFTVSGSCVPKAGITIAGDIDGNSMSSACSSTGSFAVPASLSGADGAKQITVTSGGLAGTSASVTRTVILDTTPPLVTVGSPLIQNVRQSTSTSYIVTFSDLNSVSSVLTDKINLTTSAGLTCTKSISGSGLGPFAVTISNCSGDGTVGIGVDAGAAIDPAGNASLAASSSTNVVVDNTPPTILSLALVNSAADGFINISESSLTDAVVQFVGIDAVEQSYAIVSGSTTVCNSSFSYSNVVPTSAMVGTTNGVTKKICARAKDLAGNVAYASSGTIVVDLTPIGSASLVLANGAIDGFLNAAEVASDQEVASFSGSGSTSQVYAVVSSGVTVCDASQSYSYGIPRAGAVGGSEGTRRICVKASNTSGNFAYAISPPITVDTTPPSSADTIVSLVNGATDGYLNAAEVASNSPVATLSGAIFVGYSIVDSATGTCSASLPYTAGIPLAGAVGASEGSKRICVKAGDAAGNLVYVASPIVVVDKQAPVPGNSGNLTVTYVSDTSYTVQWTAATDQSTSQSALRYQVYISTSNNLTSASTISSNGSNYGSEAQNVTSQALSGLTAGKAYWFNVLVKDEAGNRSVYSAKSLNFNSVGSGVWVAGSNSLNQQAAFGVKGAAASTNTPTSSGGAASWSDYNGNFWIFDGNLWKWNGTAWTWLSGGGSTVLSGIYGTQGIAAASNFPPPRTYASTFRDLNGNLWLFGGLSSTGAYLNDLWRWDGSYWTWMSGSSSGNQVAYYGSFGIPASGNRPGARYGAVSWVDSLGNFFLFGGSGYSSTNVGYAGPFNPNIGSLNDLWKWDGTNWAWVGGSNLLNQVGLYGTKGIAAGSNAPGARYFSTSSSDGLGNVWLFGGFGYDAGLNPGGGWLNDLWRWDGTNWTWTSGSDSVNQLDDFGVKGMASSSSRPGSLQDAISWTDNYGNFWLFGGWRNFYGGQGLLNNLWKFDGNRWTWVSGSGLLNQVGNYGTKGVGSSLNFPGARKNASSWRDSNGNLWIFGGQGFASENTFGNLNDVWKLSLSQ